MHFALNSFAKSLQTISIFSWKLCSSKSMISELFNASSNKIFISKSLKLIKTHLWLKDLRIYALDDFTSRSERTIGWIVDYIRFSNTSIEHIYTSFDSHQSRGENSQHFWGTSSNIWLNVVLVSNSGFLSRHHLLVSISVKANAIFVWSKIPQISYKRNFLSRKCVESQIIGVTKVWTTNSKSDSSKKRGKLWGSNQWLWSMSCKNLIWGECQNEILFRTVMGEVGVL